MTRLPKIRSSSFVYTSIDQSVNDAEEEEWCTEEDEVSANDDNASTSSQSTVVVKSKRKHFPPRPVDITPGNTLPVEVNMF